MDCKQMADLYLTQEDVQGKITELRDKFSQKYEDNIINHFYDRRDLNRLEDDDVYCCCFLRTMSANGCPDKAIDVIHEAFTFRKEQGIWDLTLTSIPQEIVDRKAIYYKGHDKEGHPILYFSVKSITMEDGSIAWKKFIAYNFELHHRKKPNQMCVMLFDMQDAKAVNSNAELLKFAIKCCSHYFPVYLAYLINYDMAFFLSAFWEIIKPFLTSLQRKKIVMVGKKDITKYIDAEHLWSNMK